ncbi:DUF6153 family protein [Streptomyces sp. NPDC127084]|uniref:DUF6153 family protein n=1 Tax=Streptomyces sp. NPDC127084 TaxID=3347133 RepID=UPI003658499C
MTISLPQSSRRSAGRGLLLVLAVLAGLLAMHGLAPGVPGASAVDTPHTGTGTGTGAHAGHGTGTDRGSGHCGHDVGGGANGHTDHADATCAAGATSAPYTPPALTSARDGAMPVAEPAGRCGGTTATGRAPPDLAELQLLRI